MTIEEWTDHEMRFAIGNLIGRTLKHMNCVNLYNDPRLDLISELEARTLKNALEQGVSDAAKAAHSPRRKM